MDLNIVTEWTKTLLEIVQNAPWWQSALVLFFAASIEYVFPPFPGDTIFVAGGFFASRGAIRFDVTLIALLLGTWFGTVLAWSIGYFAMQNAKTRILLIRVINPKNIERLKSLYAKYGNWILFGNRFVPGIRGPFMIASGIVQMPLSRVLFWCTASALLWNSLLIFAGVWFAKNLDAMLEFFKSYTQVLYLVMCIVAAAWVLRFFWKRYFPGDRKAPKPK